MHTQSKSHANNKNGGKEKKRTLQKIHAQFETQDNHRKTEMKGTCHICGKSLASTCGFLIAAANIFRIFGGEFI